MPEGGGLEEVIMDGLSSKSETERKHLDTCPSCEENIINKTEECPNCGFEFDGDYRYLVKGGKHKIAAAIGSAVFPGFGQLHNDQLEKAIIFLFLGSIFYYYILIYTTGRYIFEPLIIIFILWAYLIYDAYSSGSNFGS